MNLERFKTTKRDTAMSIFYLAGWLGLAGTSHMSYEAYQSHGEMQQLYDNFESNSANGELIELSDNQRKEFVNFVFATDKRILNSQSVQLSEGQVLMLPSLIRNYHDYQNDLTQALYLGFGTVAVGAVGGVGMLKEKSERQLANY